MQVNCVNLMSVLLVFLISMMFFLCSSVVVVVAVEISECPTALFFITILSIAIVTLKLILRAVEKLAIHVKTWNEHILAYMKKKTVPRKFPRFLSFLSLSRSLRFLCI